MPTRAEQFYRTSRADFSEYKRFNFSLEAAHARGAGGRVGGGTPQLADRGRPGGVDELEACADRLERAARDLAVALRELVEERREKDKL